VVNHLAVQLHFGNSQVHVRCESTIESYFTLAVFLACRRLARVEEPKLNCLAQLVYPITDEKEDRDVGLDDVCIRRPLTCWHDNSEI
jgi:hypothetical protein